ncbi:hypothetical protein SmJEL517_g03732 [Synchytrium microbalum]|uniref:Uncharacterized protein n=1 Tax=Synchytrium microbalum TaxID=1806994 RepID=A0A507C0T7_9FUNG|nr:uncharacterized protein SmJEL517_g03732 [Synchytrium microbalum]TPX33302.1 hypothetical protein SmJEL517_g03732 [Synchytrium microbalum]
MGRRGRVGNDNAMRGMDTKVVRHYESQYRGTRFITILVNLIQLVTVAVSVYYATMSSNSYYSLVQLLEMVCPLLCFVAMFRFDMEDKEKAAFLWVECSRIFFMFCFFCVISSGVNIYLILIRFGFVAISVSDPTANQILYGNPNGTVYGFSFATILKVTPCVMVGANLIGLALGIFWHRKSIHRAIPCKFS